VHVERAIIRRICSGQLVVLAAVALLLPSCQSDGNLCIFGYTTAPNYNTHIHTVYVPIFKNTTLYRDLEFQLTQAVVREIEAKTPYKVVSNRSEADTELTGKIVSFNKALLNVTPLNEVREAQTALGVEVVWRDLRTGEILSKPRPAQANTAIPAQIAPLLPGQGTMAPIPIPVPPPVVASNADAAPVLIQSLGDFIPEIGQTLATAQQQNVDRLAIQIVSMMEKPW
jgi:hypothetical protein